MKKTSPNKIPAQKTPRSEKFKYHPLKIESKWQKIWEKNKTFQVDLKKSQKPYYNLMMFPYPSAQGLHVGNMYAFTGSDVWGRYMRMKGYDVFEPIGLDGFGIHSENYAIKVGKHPLEEAKISEKNFYRQLKMIGNQFAWDNHLETYDKDYYRWTQWIFIQMFKAGLAYRAKAAVNWCPSCKTVLADEQVIQGKCERCSSEVKQKYLEQWFFRITKYADRLLNNLKKIDWTAKVKIAQHNWIGRSEGIVIDYPLCNVDKTKSLHVSCFTTRPDTNFGATFIVMAPEHPLIEKLKPYLSEKIKKQVEDYIRKVKLVSREERINQKRAKTGVFTGLYCLNRLTNKKIPLWISDFVLMEVGTGAVIGVPGHDIRDFEFAQKFHLPVIRVVVGSDGDRSSITKKEQVQEKEGTMINSQFLDGMEIRQATKKIMAYLEKKGWGKKTVHYHLRDWLISRQRYWGSPIPMIYCQKCGWQPVPEKDLPVELPYTKDWRPKGTGVSPLAQLKDWVKVKCPKCGGPAKRETDVSDTFLDSSWYFLRYPSLRLSAGKAWDSKITKKWLPVDMYIGGAEHSVLHLLYSRFVTMVFKDLGYLDFDEPFTKFRAHGLIIKDGAKMSKSKGNVVNPDKFIEKYGADTLRCYLMFLGPLSQGGDFRDTGIKGMFKFLSKVYLLVNSYCKGPALQRSGQELYWQHKTIKKVTESINRLKYNTAISSLMEYVNYLSQSPSSLEALKTLILLLAPFAPHLSEELWQRCKLRVFTSKISVHNQPWPKYNPKYIKKDKVEIVIQVNGKLRGRMLVESNSLSDQSQLKQELVGQALQLPKIKAYLKGKKPKRTIFARGRLINFVV